MAKLNLHQLEVCIRQLPVAYYAGAPIVAEATDQSECSFADLATGKVCISLNQINLAISKLPTWTQRDIRPNFYHEVAHVMNTPASSVSWMRISSNENCATVNIFEDERNETVLAHTFMNVDFRSNLFKTNCYTGPTVPLRLMNFFYAVVRFHIMPKMDCLVNFKDLYECSRKIISSYAYLDCTTSMNDYFVNGHRINGFYSYVTDIFHFFYQCEDQYNAWVNRELTQCNTRVKALKKLHALIEAGEYTPQVEDPTSNDYIVKLMLKAGIDVEGIYKTAQELLTIIEEILKKISSQASSNSTSSDNTSSDDASSGDTSSDSTSSDTSSNKDTASKHAGCTSVVDTDTKSADAKDNDDAKQDDDGEASSSKDEKPIEETSCYDNKISHKSFTDLGKSFGNLMKKSYDKDVEEVLNFKKFKKDVDGHNAFGRHCYTGKIDPKAIGKNDNWKIFIRRTPKASDGVRLGREIHLILILDQSGSYSDNDKATNKIIASMLKAEKMSPIFTFDVVKFSDRSFVAKPSERFSLSGGSTCMGPELTACIKQCIKPSALNYFILLNDGSSCTFDKVGLMSVLNNRNTAIIADGHAIQKQYTDFTTAKVISTENYPAELGKNVASMLDDFIRL